MVRYKLRTLLAKKIEDEGRRISWQEVADATGVSRQILSGLITTGRPAVTTIATLEALYWYFERQITDINDLIEFVRGPGQEGLVHVDQLYPGRRRRAGEAPDQESEG